MPSLLIPERVDRPELLDLGECAPADVRASLHDLKHINRYFGGFVSLTRHLYPRLRALPDGALIADIGTGSADIPFMISQWAARRKLRVRVLGVDLLGQHLSVAREGVRGAPGVHLVQADVERLPFALNGIDYVISSLFLHHFPPEQVIRLLCEMFARARRGIIMSDVARGWLPYAAFKVAQPAFNPVTRYDGAASIRRAYTPDEMTDMARAAGLNQVRVYRHFPWRMTLVADKP
jgi:2-polyprenyl-3-methyl-5-hydroxy-6-metoxy-1,4-benzoquinol methylase